MPRPTLLIAEPDPVQALSVRKLVMETAKYNVMTAHSTREAIDIFHLFPNVSAAVLVGAIFLFNQAYLLTYASAVSQRLLDPLLR